MIRDFSVRNFGPFKERAVLSMERTKLRDQADTVVDEGNGLVTSAIVFGANAAGKSYLIRAIEALRSLLTKPYTRLDRFPWYEPFRLSKDSLESPVEMRLRLYIRGIQYDYSIAFGRNFIASESLYYYPKGRRVRVFDRTGPESYGHGDGQIIKRTTSASSYVVVASEYNDKVCMDFRTEVLDGIVLLGGDLSTLVPESCDYIGGKPETRNFVLQALRTADTGISDYSFVEKELSPQASVDPHAVSSLRVKDGKLMASDIRLRHDLETDGVGEEQTFFPMEIESAGTKEIFGMIGPLVDVLLNGKTLVIDEFGAYLHPLISRWIVEQFANGANPQHAQLIVNTHDLDLMDINELVRRDQIWFVNRDRRTGASDLYSLADFNDVRRIKSLSKAYLFGRFDAIPSIRARDVIE